MRFLFRAMSKTFRNLAYSDPLMVIKAQPAKPFRLRQRSSICRRRFRAASNRLSVTSGASNADASRSRANKDGASNRNGGMSGTHTNDDRDGSTRNSGAADANTSGASKDGSTRNSGMADANSRSAASGDGANSRSATIPWRCQGIAYQERQAQARSPMHSQRGARMPKTASIGSQRSLKRKSVS